MDEHEASGLLPKTTNVASGSVSVNPGYFQLARIPLTGDAWFSADLRLGPLPLSLVCLAVPLGAAAAAVGALRKVNASPLGVSMRVRPPPPKANRLLPLALGVLILGIFALAGRPLERGASGSYAPTIVLGFVLMMAGLITGGPWLTFACTRVMATRAQRASTLIASRRMADNPAATFRAVSGIILGIFVGSVLIGAITTTASQGNTNPGENANTTAITRASGPAVPAHLAGELSAQLRRLPGVHAVTPVHLAANANLNGYPEGLIACNDLRATPSIGRCPVHTQVAIMPLYALDAGHTQPGTTWPAANLPAEKLAPLPIQAEILATDGSTASVERIRTLVAALTPTQLTTPVTVGELSTANRRDLDQLRHLADLAILISAIIAGCSLTVATAGGLIERKRPFSLLRLTGTPLGVLRRVVLLEAAAPLIALTVIAAGGGLLTSALLMRAVRGTTIHLPGPAYYLILLAGLTIALILISTTMPLLQRISAPQNARSE